MRGQSTANKWGNDISEERKAELEQCLQAWEQESDHREHTGPFDRRATKLRLTGADVFWLAIRALAVAAAADTSQSAHDDTEMLAALNLCRADLDWADLSGANLVLANLAGASLVRANLSGATLSQAALSGTDMSSADLSDAELLWTELVGATMIGVDLSGANLNGADLSGADLFMARLSVETDLSDMNLSTTTRVADVVWNAVPLARIAWETLPVIGDETQAHKRRDEQGKMKNAATRLAQYEVAVRAYRLLAVALRSQGLNEHADRYAYRAQLMQRVVLRRQALLRLTGKRVGLLQRLRKLAAYFGSWFLSIVAGYGYRPGRSILAYLLLVGGFAVAYYLLGAPPSHPGTYHLQWYEALVVSLTAFHGRGFFAQQYSPGDPQSVLAAVEAVVGLLLEVSFIATFTNRFFAR